MDYEKKDQMIDRPEHIKVAEKMANDIMTFEPKKQNEMLYAIREIIATNRRDEIDDLLKRADYLKESLSSL